jgi:hypothetical protein
VQITLTTSPEQIYTAGAASSVILVNQDAVSPVYSGQSKNISIGSNSADLIPPLGSVTYDGDQNLYACAADGTMPLVVITDATGFSGAPQGFIPLQPWDAFSVTSLTAFGPFPVSAYKSVWLAVRNITGRGRVALRFHADQAATEQVSAPTWFVNTNAPLLVLMPVLGPWCSFAVQGLGGAITGDAILAGSLCSTGKITYPSQSSVQTWTAQSVPASTAVVFQDGHIQKGTWAGFITPGDNSGNLDFQVVGLQSDGETVAEVLDELGAPTATTRYAGQRPDDGNLWGIKVTNSDPVGAHTFSGAITTVPG